MAARRVDRRHLIAGALTAALAASGLGAGLVAPATAAATATAAPAADVTITPDPSYQQPEFQGWGTSLAWFANLTGGYPDQVRNKLADLVFGADGLDLNIARYNIGGGDAPETKAYLRPGGAVPGWWARPAAFGKPAGAPADWTDPGGWWDPTRADMWNWNADANQRWWVQAAKARGVNTWETFSNSPPYFMTNSGVVSGNADRSADQLRADSINSFADYVTGVTEHLEQTEGIKVATIDPLNEPWDGYWAAYGGQEGANIAPATQEKLIAALSARLKTSSTGAKVSAMDETNPGRFATTWNGYADQTKADVGQLNVHAYGTAQRTSVRDIAKAQDKPLWMSEVEGSWGAGQDFVSMAPGLGMAQQMVGDMRELEPAAWVFWQPVEDYNNMTPAAENANWGSIQIPFDANQTGDYTIRTNSKFNTVRNFTHYIRPGDHFIAVDNTMTSAALRADKSGATVVHINNSTTEHTVRLDLSKFATVSGATVTPVVTSAAGALVKGATVPVTGSSVAIAVPAESVTTFLVDGVAGVAPGASALRAGHAFQLLSANSTNALAASGTSVVQQTPDADASAQQWLFQKVTAGVSNTERYRIVNRVTSAALTADSPGVLTPRAPTGAANQEWIASTTGTGSYTFVNATYGTLPDVGGQSTASGASVGLWQATSAKNQLWTPVDLTLVSTQTARVVTQPGTAPQLPQTVSGLLGGGGRADVPVTWHVPDTNWSRPGTVTIHGLATGKAGSTAAATLTVLVSRIVSTTPVAVKTWVGHTPALPATVPARLAIGGVADVPVTWNLAGLAPDAYASVGTVEVPGTVNGASALARVQVTEPGLVNLALNAQHNGLPQASASFSGPSDPPANVNDGIIDASRWTNWDPATSRASDWLQMDLAGAQKLDHVTVHFFDDAGGTRPAATVALSAWDDTTGAWVPVTAAAPVSSAVYEIKTPVTTSKIRLDMTAIPKTCIAISELEVWGPGAPGVGASAALTSLTLDGRPLAGFAPATLSYQVAATKGPQHAVPVVSATAADPYAHVTIVQGDRAKPASVTVVSEDGATTTTYTVRFAKNAPPRHT